MSPVKVKLLVECDANMEEELCFVLIQNNSKDDHRSVEQLIVSEYNLALPVVSYTN